MKHNIRQVAGEKRKLKSKFIQPKMKTLNSFSKPHQTFPRTRQQIIVYESFERWLIFWILNARAISSRVKLTTFTVSFGWLQNWKTLSTQMKMRKEFIKRKRIIWKRRHRVSLGLLCLIKVLIRLSRYICTTILNLLEQLIFLSFSKLKWRLLDITFKLFLKPSRSIVSILCLKAIHFQLSFIFRIKK